MKNKIQDLITIIFYISFSILMFFVTAKNIVNPWFLIGLNSLLLLFITLRKVFICKLENRRYLNILFVIFELGLIFLINNSDNSGFSFAYYLLILSEVTITYSSKYGGIILLICSLMYFIGVSIEYRFNPQVVLPEIIVKLPIFIGMFAVMYVLKYIMLQNDIIEQTMNSLTIKKLEQENTYFQLKQAYEKLEELTVIKERNRIAREIHDTVGHTLTTVLVELEAGKVLSEKDMDKALEKFELAQEQVRKGLYDLRNSVKVLEKGDELTDFYNAINLLINETKKHTGIIVKSEFKGSIDEFNDLDASIKKTLYNALLEGLTNGIKHGSATAFVFKLLINENAISFSLEDNGTGCSSVNLGFGLRTMRDRVADIGAKLKMESDIDEGFSLYIDINRG